MQFASITLSAAGLASGQQRLSLTTLFLHNPELPARQFISLIVVNPIDWNEA